MGSGCDLDPGGTQVSRALVRENRAARPEIEGALVREQAQLTGRLLSRLLSPDESDRAWFEEACSACATGRSDER